MKRSIKTMMAFVLGATSISMLAGLQELELQRVIAEKKLNQRYAIAYMKSQKAQDDVTAAEKAVSDAKTAVEQGQTPANTGWYEYFFTVSPLQKIKEHADAEYDLAQKNLEAVVVTKTSEDKVAQAQQALDKATLKVEQERLRLAQKEMGIEPQPATSWTVPTITAQRVGLVTAGAVTLYLLWQSRTWEGWQHLKKFEFRKFKDCIALKARLLGQKVGFMQDKQQVKTQTTKQKKIKKTEKK